MASPVHASSPALMACCELTPAKAPGTGTFEIRWVYAFLGCLGRLGSIVVELGLGHGGGRRPGRHLRQSLGGEDHQVDVEPPLRVVARLARHEPVMHHPDEASPVWKNSDPPYPCPFALSVLVCQARSSGLTQGPVTEVQAAMPML